MKSSHQILKRHPANPIITPDDMPFRCYTVMNAGATMFNNKVLLLLRVEDCMRLTNFYVATSDDGVNFDISSEPINYPLSVTEEITGPGNRFDMRITRFEDGKYYCFHANWLDKYGCCLGLATTEDFINFKPLYHLSEPSNRNAVLFPEKINGMYVRLDRPQNTSDSGSIWVSYSYDMEFWGRSMPLDMPKNNWSRKKCGASTVPVKTEKGWLEIYHGVDSTCSTDNYYLGVMLLDLNDPSKIIAAPRSMIFASEEIYECVGQTPNVVFTSGAVLMPDGTYNIYYGGADTRMCLAQTTVDELVNYCIEYDGK